MICSTSSARSRSRSCRSRSATSVEPERRSRSFSHSAENARMADAALPLETRDLTIRFGGHVAVDGVTCAFRPGTLTAIVGPNGAGKTTYFNLVSGQLKATAGQVLYGGQDITWLPASSRAQRGIGRAFQLTTLLPRLSVRENVRLAVQSRAGAGLDLFRRWTRHSELIDEAEDVLRQVALSERRDVLAGQLPHGDQRKLEVAILLAL